MKEPDSGGQDRTMGQKREATQGRAHLNPSLLFSDLLNRDYFW